MRITRPWHNRRAIADRLPTSCLPPQLATLEETNSLVRAAAAVAMHEFADTCLDDVERQLDEIAAEIAGRVSSGNRRALIAQLHAVLFDELGLAGNTENYYAPENSYLPKVLETRRGLPVTLSLVYKSVAQRIGLNARGINSPVHFLAAVELDGSWMIVDPFHDGRVLARDEVFDRLEKLAGTDRQKRRFIVHRHAHRVAGTHRPQLGASLPAHGAANGHAGNARAFVAGKRPALTDEWNCWPERETRRC